MYRTTAAANNMAFFAGSSALVAIDLSARSVAWAITNSFSGTPAVANGIVYALSGTNVLAYTQAGQFVGAYAADTTLTWQPIVTDDVLLAASSSKTYVFDLCTFNLRQALPVGGYLSLANGVLYVAGSGGQLYAYSSAPPLRIIYALLQQGGGKQISLQWPSVTGKTYNVWFATNLTSGFSPVVSNVPATPPYNIYQNTIPSSGPGFYRIEAR